MTAEEPPLLGRGIVWAKSVTSSPAISEDGHLLAADWRIEHLKPSERKAVQAIIDADLKDARRRVIARRRALMWLEGRLSIQRARLEPQVAAQRARRRLELAVGRERLEWIERRLSARRAQREWKRQLDEHRVRLRAGPSDQPHR